jgi:glutamate mutase epsilon subunit
MYAESPEYFDDFKIQIKQMERDEKVIKSDIAKRGMSDQLLDQLINLYQQKLNTLKQLQIEMNKTNNRYKQNRAPVDPVKTYFLNL